jgi:hypothetical protein
MHNDSLPRNLFLLLGCLLALTLARPAHANVYATNIRLNGGLTNAVISPGETVTISYVLNEPASGGLTLRINSGATVVRTLTLPPGNPGTLRGANTIAWDGRTDAGSAAPAGLYSVHITASSTGHTSWTQISDDANLGNYVWEGRGIGVNRDPNSAYYGRVYVANSGAGQTGKPGDQVGILMLNADGSAAEEGIFSTGGYSWAGDTFSPWHLEVSDDGLVYVNDWTRNGEIFRWDPLLSPESRVDVLRETNWGNTGYVLLSGPAVAGTGTNTTLWMADDTPGGLGLVKYSLTNISGALADGDTGVTVVSNTPEFSFVPYDVAVDAGSNLYTIQFILEAGDPTPRVLCFSATNSSQPAWAIGGQDGTMGRASGIAVDPTGTFVAVAFRGVNDPAQPGQWTNGCTQIFYATNGSLVVNLDLGRPGGSGREWHENTDCAWDAAGNVYYIDNLQTVWRAFSPPGPNESTTVSVQQIQVTEGSVVEAPRITKVEVNNGFVTLTFTGQASDPPSAYVLLGASGPTGPFVPETGYTMSAGSVPGEFRATVPLSGNVRFYRVIKSEAPVETVVINSIGIANGIVTIDFTGSPSDPPSVYRVLSAVNPAGPFLPEANYTITAGGTPGSFRAVLPTSDAFRFFRIVRSSSGTTQTPTIKSIVLAGGTVTLKFTGSAADSPSAYTLVAAPTANGTFTPEANSVVTADTVPGDFQATAPANGPMRFYRMLK